MNDGIFRELPPVRCRFGLEIRGAVQGVGFRPFLHKLAMQTGITGWARNTSGGVEAQLEGLPAQLEAFLNAVKRDPPPLALVEEIRFFPLAGLKHERDFSILESGFSDSATLIAPDTAPCPACEKELYTESDRRFRYPFINCTDCGPRYTIIRELPYDRSRTVMDRFSMCPDCSGEYHRITDRRYHAQPDCCPKCGPSVFFLDETGRRLTDKDPFCAAQQLLAAGKILAVKGAGGIHLACDANNPSAVLRLREQKKRPSKPLALMAKNRETALLVCSVTSEEEALLESPARPIVLLSKKDRDAFSEVSFSSRLGLMLPYTPLHMLLLDQHFGGPDLVVMTSANQKGCPVLTDNEEALTVLSGIADGYLLHDRPIQNRCDDSLLSVIAGSPYFIRRSRGYAPAPYISPEDVTGICALGAEQKGSFALGRENHVLISPHIGDLKNAETYDHYQNTLKTWLSLFKITPSCLVCDLHPDYFSTRQAQKMADASGLPLLQVQHHWAHMASCMADNRLSCTVFGIIWDGTGLGTDRTIWGGEFLTGDLQQFQRVGSIRPILLPGGDRAVQEIGRIGLSLLWDAGLPSSLAALSQKKIGLLEGLLASGLSCPGASSIGRLFDGFYSLIFGQDSVSYEGEGASRLEALSPEEIPSDPELFDRPAPWPVTFYEKDGVRFFDPRPFTAAAVREIAEGAPAGETARHFQLSLCHMALEQCLFLNPEKHPVVLSGGVFLNRFLLTGIQKLLTNAGYPVYVHKHVSTCDEGICLGQLAIAQAQRRSYYVSGHPHEN